MPLQLTSITVESRINVMKKSPSHLPPMSRIARIAASATFAAARDTAQQGIPVAETVEGKAVLTPAKRWLKEHAAVEDDKAIAA